MTYACLETLSSRRLPKEVGFRRRGESVEHKACLPLLANRISRQLGRDFPRDLLSPGMFCLCQPCVLISASRSHIRAGECIVAIVPRDRAGVNGADADAFIAVRGAPLHRHLAERRGGIRIYGAASAAASVRATGCASRNRQ